MAGAAMELSLDDKAVLDAFERMTVLAGDMTPLMDDIGMGLVISTQRRFETGIGPDGETWEKSARALDDGGKTLVDSARLVQSITHEAGPRDVAWGTDVAYARVHQEGAAIEAQSADFLRFPIPGGGYASVKRVEVPARPYLGIDAEDEGMIAETFMEHILAAWGRA